MAYSMMIKPIILPMLIFFGSVKQIGNYQIAKPKDVLAIRYLYHKLFYDILTYLFNGKATKK